MRLAIAIMVGMLCGCDGGEPATVPVEKTAELKLEPVSTFATYCERCHGPEGVYYARPFVNQGEALREKVEEMMRGPAGLSPTKAEVDAMVEYHLSLREKQPQ